MSELMGYIREQRKNFQKVISQDLMHAFQNGFHHKKDHILFLRTRSLNPTFGYIYTYIYSTSCCSMTMLQMLL